jgi:hypothetical protein
MMRRGVAPTGGAGVASRRREDGRFSRLAWDLSLHRIALQNRLAPRYARFAGYSGRTVLQWERNTKAVHPE